MVSPASIKRFMAVLDRLMDPAILSALATPFTGTCISHMSFSTIPCLAHALI